MVGYQTAYLKRYYPVEFFAATLTSVMGSNDKIAFYIETCKKMGIEVLPPDINESNVTFTVSSGKIRFGLAAIKNVGKSGIIAIIKARKQKGFFVSFTDFCQKVKDGELNKRAVESLIKAGAFDSLGSYRSQLLSVFEQVMEGISGDRKRNLDGQISLFDMAGSKAEATKDILPNIKEFDKRYLLTMEKEMTGLYLSGHPLSEYSNELETHTTINTSEIFDDHSDDEINVPGKHSELDNKIVTMGGILASTKIKATRSGNVMAFVNLEDMYGSIEVLIFPKIYEKYSKLVQEDDMVLIKGRLSIREDEAPKLLAEEIKPLKKFDKYNGLGKLYLKIPQKKYNEIISTIKPILSSMRGPSPVYLVLEDGTNSKKNVQVANKELWVEITDDLLSKLYEILGQDCVKVG
ncbi:DNA polymerase III subunit alpha [Oxobacter pfennigii]|uniref:DNA polymerase III subunit alpha n=1 Tax=Oxobacter pfennigii TaxID=36849 RepID=A0A0P8WLT9_9CLOT|nr:OB-fold nucleic acid binding domain-containing protein [Oxobacter pfennigii]KPU43445.1 DNA polymerase III subunit alpha [Oxobacter pfennigii]